MKFAPNLIKTFFHILAPFSCNKLIINFLFKRFWGKNKFTYSFVSQLVRFLLYLQYYFWNFFQARYGRVQFYA